MNFLEHESEEINNVVNSKTVPFEVILDSGAADHVADATCAPGYSVEPSKGSRMNIVFIAANGDRIANEGQMKLNLIGQGGAQIESTFQACKVNRPLWSVAKICDSGYEVLFTASGAHVRSPGTTKSICSFDKVGGLYIGNLQLRSSETGDFSRPGK